MSVRIKEPVLWLGIGFGLAFAAKVIFFELQFVRKLMKVHPKEQKDEGDDSRKGDAISPEALATLAESPTYESRAAALLVISERAARGQARKLLLKDLTSKSRRVRDRALTALHFIVCNGIVARGNASQHFKRDPDTFVAIVECLCNLLPEHAEQGSSCPLRRAPPTRPPAEWKALRILDAVLQENVRAALDAGVVTRWLVNYPFAGSGYDDSSVVDLVSHCWSNDALMGSIISAIATDVQGRKQLRDADLINGGVSEDKDESNNEFDDEEQTDYYGADWERPNDSTFSVDSIIDRSASVSPASGFSTPSRTRRRERSTSLTAEEQALRRRRREAMIINQPGQAIEIIEPNIPSMHSQRGAQHADRSFSYSGDLDPEWV